MTGREIVRLIFFVLPLGLDTFALSLILGVMPLPGRQRIRLALIFAAAEGVMPAIGLLIGLPLGSAIGEWSAYLAGILLLGVGVWMWRHEQGKSNEADEVARMASAAMKIGWGALALAFSISLDELAIGFSIGVLGFPLIPTLILIALQALFLSLIGLWIGKYAGRQLGKWAESLAGPILILLGLGVILAHLLRLPF